MRTRARTTMTTKNMCCVTFKTTQNGIPHYDSADLSRLIGNSPLSSRTSLQELRDTIRWSKGSVNKMILSHISEGALCRLRDIFNVAFFVGYFPEYFKEAEMRWWQNLERFLPYQEANIPSPFWKSREKCSRGSYANA